jgi:hypothetical protein
MTRRWTPIREQNRRLRVLNEIGRIRALTPIESAELESLERRRELRLYRAAIADQDRALRAREDQLARTPQPKGFA